MHTYLKAELNTLEHIHKDLQQVHANEARKILMWQFAKDIINIQLINCI